jgi:hypothetical protein
MDDLIVADVLSYHYDQESHCYKVTTTNKIFTIDGFVESARSIYSNGLAVSEVTFKVGSDE